MEMTSPNGPVILKRKQMIEYMFDSCSVFIDSKAVSAYNENVLRKQTDMPAQRRHENIGESESIIFPGLEFLF